ncbi:MAG: F0F1 ATP synthase subunit A [Alphaproteobacteria bacterium CG_4_9_14_3_um_filter_47_13]|nr:MAG: F0F1 ATP synthase subunit A [Alphaproteobacteria bacterium CG_4_9_14_3_um_filter_47_13]
MADPLHQFVIEPIVTLKIGGLDLSFTNSSLWMIIGVVTSVGFMSIAMGHKALVPGRMQVLTEMFYEMVAGLVRSNIGHDGRKYFPFVFTLFILVLMGNLLGLIPYSFTFTSHIIVTAALSFFVFFVVMIMALIKHKMKFFAHFVPPGVPWFVYPILVPIELVSYMARPITHGLRLFANMLAGHIMLKVFAGFSVGLASTGFLGFAAGIVPMLVNTGLIAFELLIALLQAYVFAILACIYLKDTVEMDH